MSVEEIKSRIASLTPEEQGEVSAFIFQLRHSDGTESPKHGDELWPESLPPPNQTPSPEIIALLDARMEEYRREPASAAPWAEVKERLRAARGQARR